MGVATPMIKQPNPTLKSNKDWSEIDFEAMPEDFIPATAYAPNRDSSDYDSAYQHHHSPDGILVADRSMFRFAWRKMAATTGYRTLYSSLIPPGAAISGALVSGVSITIAEDTVATGASLSTLLTDFVIRSTGLANLYASTIELLPVSDGGRFRSIMIQNYLRLNCLTSAYAPLWEEITGEPWSHGHSPAQR